MSFEQFQPLLINPALRAGVTLAIPALNEEKRLESTIEGLRTCLSQLPDLDVEIIIINDGSTDRTGEIAERIGQSDPRVRVIHHSTNLGLGQSIRDAIASARRDRFLIVPGDNDMSANILPHMLSQCHRAEMVMCYFLDREKRSLVRNLLSAIFGAIYMSIFNIHVQYINGPCVYSTARIQNLTLRSSRFSIVAEINVKLLREGITFLELPATRQTADTDSKALRWHNLVETSRIFWHLLWEIHWDRSGRYAGQPVRLDIN
jgi:glycosyltransferase involved in cell wall biosynthesis